ALAPWTQLEESIDPLAGRVHADATVTGTLAAPIAALKVSGRDIRVAGLENVALQASGRASTDSAELTTLDVRVGGGTVTGRGQTSLPAGAGDVHLAWRQLDLATLMRQLLRDAPPLAARMDGSLDARWPG